MAASGTQSRSPASGTRVRPVFASMWLRFQDVGPDADSSYPDGVIKSLTRIGNTIGGAVKRNFDLGIQDIRSSPGSFPLTPVGFTNGCATRMSYCLNYGGLSVPKIGGQTVTGADQKNYIFRVRQMIGFLGGALGTPDINKGASAVRNDFIGKRGIIAFGVPFADASGHVTLWDGQQAADEDYFDPVSRHNLPLTSAGLWICP